MLKHCQVCKRILKICVCVYCLVAVSAAEELDEEMAWLFIWPIVSNCSYLSWSLFCVTLSSTVAPYLSVTLITLLSVCPPHFPPLANLSLSDLRSEWLCLMLYHDWWRGESALSVCRVPRGAGAGGGAGGGEARCTDALQGWCSGSGCWPWTRPWRGGGEGAVEEGEQKWWRMESWSSGAWRAGTGAGSWTNTGSSHHCSYSRSRLCLRGGGAAAVPSSVPHGLLLLEANNKASQLVSSYRL